jgi:hypothetical protein
MGSRAIAVCATPCARVIVTLSLMAALSACGGGGDAGTATQLAGSSAASSGAPVTTPPATAVPTALIGTWGFAAAMGQYCNSLGQCAPGGGGSESFSFSTDGQAEYAILESSLVEACGEVKTLTHLAGHVSVVGAGIVFTPTSGVYSARNACRPDLSADWTLGTNDLKPIAMTWRLVPDEQNPGQDALQLVDATGEASGTYTRCPG